MRGALPDGWVDIEIPHPFAANGPKNKVHKIVRAYLLTVYDGSEATGVNTACRSSVTTDPFWLDNPPSDESQKCLDCFYPELAEKKRAARSFANRAIKDGLLERQPCEICGNPKSDAHHDDYDKPLEVRWLCRRDHAKWHIAAKASGIDPSDLWVQKRVSA